MNLSATSFELEHARACAALCKRVYHEATVSVTDTDTHLLIDEHPDHVLIAFRGTHSIRNWITDADFERKLLCVTAEGEQCRVHAGFLNAFDSVIEPLAAALKEISVNARPIYVTGHSLGGALAVLCALELKRQKYNVAQVYTFGQPRVGNGAFALLYNSTISSHFRVVHEEDIVARVPHLPAIHDPYRHCGVEVFIPADAPDTCLINPPLGRLLLSDIWGLWRAFNLSYLACALDPIVDHYVDHYVLALDGIRNSNS